MHLAPVLMFIESQIQLLKSEFEWNEKNFLEGGSIAKYMIDADW